MTIQDYEIIYDTVINWVEQAIEDSDTNTIDGVEHQHEIALLHFFAHHNYNFVDMQRVRKVFTAIERNV